jgi:hypothetical protein
LLHKFRLQERMALIIKKDDLFVPKEKGGNRNHMIIIGLFRTFHRNKQ